MDRARSGRKSHAVIAAVETHGVQAGSKKTIVPKYEIKDYTILVFYAVGAYKTSKHRLAIIQLLKSSLVGMK